ncbi:MAG: homocysteine methyltransferase, partial [Ruminiclostridium sp.]|nr:homocysteine methyltransferase [Ruminiclostridium sp.]
YRLYKEAGSDVIQTNTFPGNRIHLDKYSLGDKTYEINYWGAKLARETAGDNTLVAASIGPIGQLFEPSGELTFEKAYEVFSEQVKAVTDGGVDIINFETFTDVAEMRAALLAAKENSNLPVICSMAYEANGRTLMGNDPFIAVSVLLSLGADMAGVNCSFGAGHMLDIVKKMHDARGGYLSVKPNAGLPEVIDGKVCYHETAENFAEQTAGYVKYGARLIGGCCGTTPEYIKAIRDTVGKMEPVPVKKRERGIITSGTRTFPVAELKTGSVGKLDTSIDNELLYRLNKGDFTYLEDLVLDLSTESFDAVMINTDAAAGNGELLARTVNIAQSYIKVPLILKTVNPSTLENALRIYKGIAGIVADEAENENRNRILKLAGKYGSEIVLWDD